MKIEKPYLVFLGEADNLDDAKTATGIIKWIPEHCKGQYRMSDKTISVGLPDVSLEEAVGLGIKTLVVGCVSHGGIIPENWKNIFATALKQGLNVASGMHEKLSNDVRLKKIAEDNNKKIYDFRYQEQKYPLGSGEKRTGKRLLTVGTDSIIGKKFTAMAIYRELQRLKIKSSFRSTGQTGFLISNGGINNDTIICDFLSGAAEWLSPDNESEHWYIIEGQGSIWHPSYCGGSLSLLMGSQPDQIVVCHDPRREKQYGTNFDLPSIKAEIEANIYLGKRTNPNIKCTGISINFTGMTTEEKINYSTRLNEELKSMDLKLPYIFDANDSEAVNRFVREVIL